MDWLNFLASLIDSLAWPAAVVIGILILRRALGYLIPDLKHLRYKDFELQFGKKLDDVRHHLESHPSETLQPPMPSAIQGVDEVSKTEYIPYFEIIAEVSPRAAIMEAWIGFEATAKSLVQKLDLQAPRRSMSLHSLIGALRHGELITQEELEALTMLRAIRNEILHGHDRRLSKEDAAEYARIITEMAEGIVVRARPRMAEN